MPNKLITIKDIRSIISLSQKGFSVRHISREMRLSRNTVFTYRERFKASSFTGEELLKMDDPRFSAIAYASARQWQPELQKQYFVSRIEYFLAELKRTGVTRCLLWEEYKKNTLTVIAIHNFTTCFHSIEKFMKLPCQSLSF